MLQDIKVDLQATETLRTNIRLLPRKETENGWTGMLPMYGSNLTD